MNNIGNNIYEFDAFDLLEITLFAERQHSFKVATNATTQRFDKNKTEFELHYIGAMAEKCVSTVWSVPMDRTIHLGGDNGTDVTINNWTCEIKAHAYTGPGLEFFITDMSRFKADVLIGVQILSPVRVKLVGCISRAYFDKSRFSKDYDYGDRCAVSAAKLSPVEYLHTYTTKEDLYNAELERFNNA